MRCMDCGKEMRFTSEPLTETYRGEKITVNGIERYVCECGNDEMTASEATKLAHLLAKEYSRRHDMLQPGDIKALRNELNMTQREFESLLGVSKPTASRWENGASQQSETADRLMKLLRDVPQAREYFGIQGTSRKEGSLHTKVFSVMKGGKGLKYVDKEASKNDACLRIEV